MEFIVGFFVALGVVFALTIFFGPPYLRTHKAPVETALDLLGIKEGSHLLDLGSGDGSVLLAAARRGARATGYEINPALVLTSLWRTRKYRKQVRIKWANMWRATIDDKTENVFMFMDKRFTETAEKFLNDPGVRLKFVSYSYRLPTMKPEKSKDGVHLYVFGD
jgi:SAM-dependent methyltransferase